MPSERRLLALLRSQGLGMFCAQGTVLLLAIGSVVLASTRDGASRFVHLDELRGFFMPASPVHGWLYLLLPLMFLYGINTALCSWRSVQARWSAGVRRLPAYATALIHLSFLLSLVAHLVAALGGEEQRPLRLSADWIEVEQGLDARLLTVDLDTYPSGGTKSVEASVELRDAQGEIRQDVLGYNAPITWRLGTRLLLLQSVDQDPTGAVLFAAGERCTLRPSQACELGGRRLILQHLLPPSRRWGPEPVAVLGSDLGGFVVVPRGSRRAVGDLQVTLESVDSRPVILAKPRSSPGNPLALLSAAVMILGVGLMGRRWLPVGPHGSTINT